MCMLVITFKLKPGRLVSLVVLKIRSVSLGSINVEAFPIYSAFIVGSSEVPGS